MPPGARRRLLIGRSDAERALDGADEAADRRADDGTDRPGDAVAFMQAMDEPAGRALSVGRERCGDGGDGDNACVQHLRFHAAAPLFLLRWRQTPAKIGVSVTMVWR